MSKYHICPICNKRWIETDITLMELKYGVSDVKICNECKNKGVKR